MLSHPPDTPTPPGRLRLTNEGLAWLAAAAVLGAVGWFKSLNLPLLLAYGMVGLLVVNGVLARLQARRVAVTPAPPAPPAYAGEEARVEVHVVNTSARPAAAITLASPDVSGGGWAFERLLPGTGAAAAGPRVRLGRGRHRLRRSVLASSYPFGLLVYERPAGGSGEVVVLPALGRVDADGLRRWAVRTAAGDDRNRKVLRRATADQADVRGVRPYRPGDSLRWVHWKSSARRRELMVREYDAAPTPDLVLAVEPWLPPKPAPADRHRVEAALSLAATVARAWCLALEGRVLLVVLGQPAPDGFLPPGETGLRDGLAPLADATGEPSFPPVGERALGRAGRAAARVLVSSRPDSPAAADLARAAGRPFVAVAASARPSWYQPPAGA